MQEVRHYTNLVLWLLIGMLVQVYFIRVIYFLFHLSLALLLRYRCKIVFSLEDGSPFTLLGFQADFPPLYFYTTALRPYIVFTLS